MKSTKIMLSGIMLALLAIAGMFIEGDRNTALGGICLFVILLAVIVFIIGLATKN